MTPARIGELVAAALLIAAGIVLYRRNRAVDGGYGSQGAMLMWAGAVIFLILGLGLMEYRPSQAELDSAKAHAQ
jgi:hypothetical protein